MATILVADDYGCIRTLVRATLEDDHEILEAADGTEALRVVREQQPDLVLLDAVLPDLDGFAVCWRLKEDPVTSNVPVVFLTGLRRPTQLEQILASIADGYLAKPFRPPALVQIVNRILERRDCGNQHHRHD